MKVTLEQLYAYVEGELDEASRERVEQAIANDPNLADEWAALEAAKLPYKSAFDRTDLPATPNDLRHQLDEWIRLAGNAQLKVENTSYRWLKAVSLVAGIVIVFTLGFISSSYQWSNRSATELAQEQTDEVINWVKLVADYQSLYVRNTVAGVEGGVTSAQVLLDKLQQQQGVDYRIPEFDPQGYQFKRAQELGYQNRPLVQLVYLKNEGVPLALCFMPDPGADSAAVTGNHAGLGTVSWRQNNQRFVIVAAEPGQQLQQLQQIASDAWKS